MNISFLPWLLVILFTLSGCGQPTATAPSSPSSDTLATTQEAASTQVASKGQQLFMTHCASCHQSMSQTPGPNAIILNSKTLADANSFKALLRQPISPMMPAFGPESISDADAQELYTYLHGEQSQHQAAAE